MEKGKIKVFRSRISVLPVVFMLVMFIFALIPIFQRAIYQGMNIFVIMFLFFAFVLFGIRYVISGDTLCLKVWMIHKGSVNIADIISVERSYKQPPLQASPAASFKKLRLDLTGVTFGSKRAKFPYLLISPVREQEFIEELKAINPDIIVDVPVKKGIWRIQDWDI